MEPNMTRTNDVAWRNKNMSTAPYDAFFTAERSNLFRPLAGKYRELALASLKSLYARLHGAEADYDTLVTREYVRDVLAQLVHIVPTIAEQDGTDISEVLDANDENTMANSLIRIFISTGWLQKHHDKGTMVTTYRFSRVGKTLIEALTYMDQRGIRTRQRNVRNTHNALDQYVRTEDPYNLIDAVDYAQRVVSDISDDIADLEERKADLTRAAATKVSLAIDEFLEYMDKVFAPDLAIRMAADSVERHRHRIEQLAEDIHGWRPERLAQAEQRLARLHLEIDVRAGESRVLRMLDKIRGAVEAACNVKMPELRDSLNGFVNRAHIIIRYASAMNGAEERTVGHLLQRLGRIAVPEQDRTLFRIAARMEPFQPELPNPASVRLRARTMRREVEEISPAPALTPEEELQAALAQAEETAFAVSMTEIHRVVVEQMGDGSFLRTSNMVITDAPSLLAASHAIEAAGIGIDESPQLVLLPATAQPQRYTTPYVEADEFEIRKM